MFSASVALFPSFFPAAEPAGKDFSAIYPFFKLAFSYDLVR